MGRRRGRGEPGDEKKKAPIGRLFRPNARVPYFVTTNFPFIRAEWPGKEQKKL